MNKLADFIHNGYSGPRITTTAKVLTMDKPKRKMGRPMKRDGEVRPQVRMPRSLLERVDGQATSEGMTRDAVIRRAITEDLNWREKSKRTR